MDFFSTDTFDLFLRLIIAMFLGLSLGTERVLAKKTAGMRTYALVAIGSALFVIVSQVVASQYTSLTNFDPLRVASQIVVGLGFIGAGIIIYRGSHVSGLTTAAGLWATGGIGIAVGFGLYYLAFFATFLTLFVFTIMWFVEYRIKKASGRWEADEI